MTLSAAALCGVLTPVMALGNPTIRVADGVEYMSGGRDAEEMGFLQMVSPRWAVALEFAVNRGPRNAFPASVKVSVNDKYTGRPVMDAMCNGPVMLARLSGDDSADADAKTFASIEYIHSVGKAISDDELVGLAAAGDVIVEAPPGPVKISP